MRFIIFGPPGAGKGTYSSRIATLLDIVRISTGDIFRDHIKKGTELGRKIEDYLRNGTLVPDDIVINVVEARIAQPDCKNGFILDGYPRTLIQAESLEEIKIDAIINLIVPEEILIAKLAARRVCRDCGNIYNILKINTTIGGITYVLPSMNSKVEGKCDKCNGELIQREDDIPNVIEARLRVYAEQSHPVIKYYRGKIPFIDIHVTRGPEIMVDAILEKLKSKNLIRLIKKK